MKDFLVRMTTGCLVLGLTASCTGALAQQAQIRMAQAAHRGTFNYLRVAPDKHSHILLKMRQGTRFEVVGAQGDYYAVILANGMRGWTFNTNARFE